MQPGVNRDLSIQLLEKQPPITVDSNGGSSSTLAGFPGILICCQWEQSGARQNPQTFSGILSRRSRRSTRTGMSCAYWSCSWHVLNLFISRNGSSVLVDGYNLSIPAITAAARYNAPVTVDDSAGVRERLQQSRDVIVSKKSAGKSVYGVSTGYGGSGQCRPLAPCDSLHS